MRMADVDTLSATLFAVADPTRRGLIAQLALGESTVKELARPHDMSVAAISKHLVVLENAGLVRRRQEGQYTHCSLRAEPLRRVSAWLDDYRAFWERSLDALDDHLLTLHPPAHATKTKTTKKEKAKK